MVVMLSSDSHYLDSSKWVFASWDKPIENQGEIKKKISFAVKRAIKKFYTEQYKGLLEDETENKVRDALCLAIREDSSFNRLAKQALEANPLFMVEYFKREFQFELDELNVFNSAYINFLQKAFKNNLIVDVLCPGTDPMPSAPVKYITTPSDTPFEVYTALKKNDLTWRLFVDGFKQKGESAWSYDRREPGCLEAMASALSYALTTMAKPLSFELLVALHDICIHDVSALNEDVYKDKYRLRGTPPSFGFGATPTLACIKEICLDANCGKDFSYRCGRFLAILEGDLLVHRVETILSEYEAAMKSAISPEQKLQFIAAMICKIERIHPFWDANCRVLCVVLLNRELIKHGFSPVILEDPNFFDNYSSNEMVNEIIKGFQNFEHVVKTGHYPGEDPRRVLSTDEATKAKEIMTGVTNQLRADLYSSSTYRY